MDLNSNQYMTQLYNKTFIIDICGTLYRSNTTFDFIKYYFSDKPIYKIVNILRHFRCFVLLNHLVFKYFKLDILRWLAVRTTKGYSKAELDEMAKQFVEKYLEKLVNSQVVDIIESYRAKSYDLIIASATLDIISEQVAKRFSIKKEYSSRLSFNGDYCKGFISKDMLGNKKRILGEFRINPRFGGIITDNYSDCDLINDSENVYLVLYTNRRDKWKEILSKKKLQECHYVNIDS